MADGNPNSISVFGANEQFVLVSSTAPQLDSHYLFEPPAEAQGVSISDPMLHGCSWERITFYGEAHRKVLSGLRRIISGAKVLVFVCCSTPFINEVLSWAEKKLIVGISNCLLSEDVTIRAEGLTLYGSYAQGGSLGGFANWLTIFVPCSADVWGAIISSQCCKNICIVGGRYQVFPKEFDGVVGKGQFALAQVQACVLDLSSLESLLVATRSRLYLDPSCRIVGTVFSPEFESPLVSLGIGADCDIDLVLNLVANSCGQLQSLEINICCLDDTTARHLAKIESLRHLELSCLESISLSKTFRLPMITSLVIPEEILHLNQPILSQLFPSAALYKDSLESPFGYAWLTEASTDHEK